MGLIAPPTVPMHIIKPKITPCARSPNNSPTSGDIKVANPPCAIPYIIANRINIQKLPAISSIINESTKVTQHMVIALLQPILSLMLPSMSLPSILIPPIRDKTRAALVSEMPISMAYGVMCTKIMFTQNQMAKYKIEAIHSCLVRIES